MAGDPDEAASLEILKALPHAGADVIELGMPFTDPMADGPAIQAAGLRALKSGQDMKKTLRIVREFRAGDDATPIVLMGYFNPIYVYGVDRFLADAKSAGVDGLIVVDLPPEEDEELCLPALKAGVNFIRLATPTTDDKRLAVVLSNTSGFVYYVSIAGITGSAAPDAAKVNAAVARIKRQTALPVCVGFGVRTAEQARGIAQRRRWCGRRVCAGRCGAQESRRQRQGDRRDRESGHRSRFRTRRRRAQRATAGSSRRFIRTPRSRFRRCR